MNRLPAEMGGATTHSLKQFGRPTNLDLGFATRVKANRHIGRRSNSTRHSRRFIGGNSPPGAGRRAEGQHLDVLRSLQIRARLISIAQVWLQRAATANRESAGQDSVGC